MIVLSNRILNYKNFVIILFSLGGVVLLLSFFSSNKSFPFILTCALLLCTSGLILVKTGTSSSIIKYDAHNGSLYVENQKGSINIPNENILNLRLKYETNKNQSWRDYACYSIVTRVNGSMVNYTFKVYDRDRDQQENYRKFKAIVAFLRYERIQNLKKK